MFIETTLFSQALKSFVSYLQLGCHLMLGGRGKGGGQLGCHLMLGGRGRGRGQLGCHLMLGGKEGKR